MQNRDEDYETDASVIRDAIVEFFLSVEGQKMGIRRMLIGEVTLAGNINYSFLHERKSCSRVNPFTPLLFIDG